MKKILNLLLFFGVLAFGLVACSDDDDDKLSGIVESIDMQIDGKTVATQKFTYDQEGRLIKVTEPAFGEDGIGEVFYEFSYADAEVTMSFVEVSEIDTYKFKLEDGKATSFTWESKWSTGEGELVYDGNKLQTWIEDWRSMEFTWKDGNIIFIDDEDFEGKVFPYENNANIDYNAIFSAFPDLMMCGAAYAGILGEKSKNVILPQGVDYKIETKDGYITEISFVEEEEGETYTMTMKFNYK